MPNNPEHDKELTHEDIAVIVLRYARSEEFSDNAKVKFITAVLNSIYNDSVRVKHGTVH